MNYDIGDYVWFRDDLARIEDFSGEGRYRIRLVENTTNSEENSERIEWEQSLEPVTHTYYDRDNDQWDLNLNDGRYYCEEADRGAASAGLTLRELLCHWGPVTESPQEDEMPEIGTFLKPKDAVYEVLGWDSNDGTAEVRDVHTNARHTILLEFYEETKPPVPNVGEVWAATETLEGDDDGIAYLVSRVNGTSVTLTSAFTEITLDASTIRASQYWNRVF